MRHVLETTHHPLVPEVVRERLGPLGQELHQLWSHVTETDLDTVCHVNKECVRVCVSVCPSHLVQQGVS